jgi:hypothetical protein
MRKGQEDQIEEEDDSIINDPDSLMELPDIGQASAHKLTREQRQPTQHH